MRAFCVERHRGHTADPGVQALERLERNQVRHHLVDTEPLRKPSTAGTMGGMGRLGELLRGLQRARSSLGSAAAPSPVELPVPEDLLRPSKRNWVGVPESIGLTESRSRVPVM